MHHPHNDTDVKNLITNSGDKIVIVKFGATWCPPCVALAPELEELAKEYANNEKVVFASVDVDECAVASEDASIASIPDTRFFIKGEDKAKVVGRNI
jgi:thioredoxin 1